MPKEFGPWQTVYDRFSEWRRAGVFEEVFRRRRHLSQAKHGLAFDWQAADGTSVGSPWGGKRQRPQSDDRW
jgi:putative transposase